MVKLLNIPFLSTIRRQSGHHRRIQLVIITSGSLAFCLTLSWFIYFGTCLFCDALPNDTTRGRHALGLTFQDVYYARHQAWIYRLQRDIVRDRYDFLPHSLAMRIAPFLVYDNSRWSGTSFPIKELMDTPHPSTYLPLPSLSIPTFRNVSLLLPPSMADFLPPSVITQQYSSPAFLAFHIFSMRGDNNRMMRNRHRRFEKHRIPKRYSHLVDYKFVICSPPEDDSEGWQILAEEQAIHGDLMILDNGKLWNQRMNENMDQGKTYRWMQENVRFKEEELGREAWWTFKVDEDTYTQLPWLVEWLVEKDPKLPVYAGSQEQMPIRWNRYHTGMIYGLSWPLVSSASEIGRGVRVLNR